MRPFYNPTMLRSAVSLAVSRRNRPSEILLVERSRKLRFFGGFHAFPGGAVDDEDRSVPVEGVSDPALAPILAAGARELFEETGLWIARGEAPEVNELREDRRRLIAGEASFSAILAVVLSAARLRWVRWPRPRSCRDLCPDRRQHPVQDRRRLLNLAFRHVQRRQ